MTIEKELADVVREIHCGYRSAVVEEPGLPGSSFISEEPLDDYVLMRQIGAGDAAALRAFYDRHSATVYTLCLRMLKDPQDAEQLLTDVFFEIWNSRARYDEARANPLTYLLRITRSRGIDKLRRKGPPGSSGSVSLNPAAGIDIAVDQAPESAAESDENRARIQRALQRLDREQRAVIECAYFEGLSHAQIADKLQKPLGTVKSTMRQGLVRLRELLGDPQQERPSEPS